MGEWVPLLVRSEDYVEFARMVADREAGKVEAPAGNVSVLLEEDASGSGGSGRALAEAEAALAQLEPWDLPSLRQLAGGEYKTTRRWAAALDVCCRHVGRFLSSDEVAREAGMPVNQWRDAARKLTRHLQVHYQVPGWPLAAVDGRRLDADPQVYWAVTAEQAERWGEIRGTGAG